MLNSDLTTAERSNATTERQRCAEMTAPALIPSGVARRVGGDRVAAPVMISGTARALPAAVRVEVAYDFAREQIIAAPWRPTQGEHRLVLAVLQRAVADLCGDAPDLRADAAAYFAGTVVMVSGALYPFAFGALCQALGWEPAYVRRLVEALQSA